MSGLRFSVIMPLYNKHTYVARAIQSVLSQTHTDFELLVVDDGSTDASVEVVRQFSDTRIRLIQQPNDGVSAARNRGVKEARADYVAFLDADDEWRPTFLSCVSAVITTCPQITGVFTNFEMASTGMQAIRCSTRVPVLVQDYFTFCRPHYGEYGICSITLAVRKDSLLSCGGFPVGRKNGEDVDTWYRLACNGRLVFVPESLAIYHNTDPSAGLRESNPDVWNSWVRLSSAGEIREDLARSAKRHALDSRVKTVVCRLRDGKLREARQLIRAVPLRHLCSGPSWVAVAVCEIPFLPAVLRWSLLRIWERLSTAEHFEI